jgi:hypothetical protein
MGPSDLRLFAEAALLGVKNYPFYYEKASERMPVMLGFNVPAFRLLDILCLQAEWYGSRFNQSNDKVTLGKGLPIPDATDFAAHELRDRNIDNWKWSVFAKRTINPGLRLYFQVANDHLRTITFRFIDETYPVFNRPSHWYYMFKVEYGI